MSKAQVLIVGGGPAGAAAGIWCARRGLSVVLLERESFPRHRPGETLHPGIEPLLEQLGVKEAILAAGFVRHEGYQVRWETGKPRFEAYGGDEKGPWQGFQATRGELDTILSARAREAGAQVFQPCQVKRALIEQGRVVGVETDHGRIKAGFVIDAAGDRHWLARQLSLQIDHASPPLAVSYGYVADQQPLLSAMPEIEADEQGWTWTAPVRAGVTAWTRLSFSRTSRQGMPD